MIFDSRLEFSDAQAVTSSAASTNIVDLTSDRDVGPGERLWLVLTVQTAITGSSPTVSAVLQTDDNASFSSATAIATLETLTATNGTAGATFFMAVPSNNERYLRVNYTAGGTVSTGAVNAFLTNQEPKYHAAYPDAI